MRPLVVGLVMTAALGLACSKPPVDPLQLDGSRLTVDNRTADNWTGVEIWLNNYYRITADTIPAHSRFQASLSSFVEGWGRRFDYSTTPVKDLRLTAKGRDGHPVEIKKQFIESGLAGALGRKQ